MRKFVVVLMLLLVLTGCNAHGDMLDPAIDLKNVSISTPSGKMKVRAYVNYDRMFVDISSFEFYLTYFSSGVSILATPRNALVYLDGYFVNGMPIDLEGRGMSITRPTGRAVDIDYLAEIFGFTFDKESKYLSYVEEEPTGEMDDLPWFEGAELVDEYAVYKVYQGRIEDASRIGNEPMSDIFRDYVLEIEELNFNVEAETSTHMLMTTGARVVFVAVEFDGRFKVVLANCKMKE